MLKKEHLAFRISGTAVKPKMVDPADPALLMLAERLIALYTQAAGAAMHRGELETAAAALIRAEKDVKTASALNKLLLDRTEFAVPMELDYPVLRHETFLRSAQLLRSGTLQPTEPELDIYGDLPDFETVRSWKNTTPQALLHRLNLAQAQGLLCHAQRLDLTIADSDRTELRKLLKTIKFFRLLAHFYQRKKGVINVEISGPFALFGATTKYALNLANMLPALVKLPKWSLHAAVQLKGRELNLKLDEKSGLVSHYRNLSSYIPEEFKLFHRAFAEKSQEWQIVGDTPFLDAGEQEIIFPDLSFQHIASGKTVHLELFHRWHAGELDRRIARLKSHPYLPLILGIDRALIADKEDLNAKFADAPQLAQRCWLFRDFPGVESTLRVLKHL